MITADRVPRLRIACSGVVGAEDGSVASAGFYVLQELLRRGHLVDFFSKRTYVYPERLMDHPGFTYYACDQPRLDSLISHMRHGHARWVGLQIGNAIYMRRITRTMGRCHRACPYDSELFLGQWAYGRIPRVPVVSWVQGPPGTDARSVTRHRQTIRSLCGWREYVLLKGYGAYRESRLGRPTFRHTDVSICGSRGSEDTLVTHYGLLPRAVHVLPYPVDLDVFRPARRPDYETVHDGGTPFEVLWIGRIVPRKRLDLFLDAGAHLIRNGYNVKLTVVGGYPFARAYHHLVERFPFPERLTYVPHLARDEVRRRMQMASVLVQPSEEENFGSAVAEALACGTPVVLGPSNGTGDYMGKAGQRFEEYSVASVAEAIRQMLALVAGSSLDVRGEARKAALEHFAVESIVGRLEAILRTAESADQGDAWDIN